MLLLIVCIAALILGYLVYSKFVEGAILPHRDTTPAVSMSDGMDYVPLSKRTNLLIGATLTIIISVAFAKYYVRKTSL